jgi:hypothetical protein
VAELRRLGDMVIGHFQEVLDEERKLQAGKLEAD